MGQSVSLTVQVNAWLCEERSALAEKIRVLAQRSTHCDREAQSIQKQMNVSQAKVNALWAEYECQVSGRGGVFNSAEMPYQLVHAKHDRRDRHARHLVSFGFIWLHLASSGSYVLQQHDIDPTS